MSQPMIKPNCEEKTRLLVSYQTATEKYSAADCELVKKMGTAPEFNSLREVGESGGMQPDAGRMIPISRCRNFQFLPNFNLVRIFQLVFIGIEDPHILIRTSIKLLANFR